MRHRAQFVRQAAVDLADQRADELARQLELERIHRKVRYARVGREGKLKKVASELRDENARLKRAQKRFYFVEGEYEGRSAESWALECKYLRQIWHDHHLEGWCAAQAQVNDLLHLLRDPRYYKKVDNWRLELIRQGEWHWRCSICKRVFPSPLGHEWAIKPCPHKGAPMEIVK